MKKIKLACLIEDDAIQILLMTRFLQRTEAVEQIVVFKNGKEAFEGLKARVENGEAMPELILLDLNMPIWDGWTFLEEFKKLAFEAEVRIFIHTSSQSNADIARAEQFNLQHQYLIKPVDIVQLKAIIETIKSERI